MSNDLSLRSAQIQKIAFGLSKGWLNRVKFKIVATEQDLPDYVKQAKKEQGADGDHAYGVIAQEPATYILRIET